MPSGAAARGVSEVALTRRSGTKKKENPGLICRMRLSDGTQSMDQRLCEEKGGRSVNTAAVLVLLSAPAAAETRWLPAASVRQQKLKNLYRGEDSCVDFS